MSVRVLGIRGDAIIGSLAGGFLLLPFLTAPGSWKGVVFLLTIAGIAAGLYSFRHEQRTGFLILPAATLAGALLLLSATGPTAAWRHSPIGAGGLEPQQPQRNQGLDAQSPPGFNLGGRGTGGQPGTDRRKRSGVCYQRKN